MASADDFDGRVDPAPFLERVDLGPSLADAALLSRNRRARFTSCALAEVGSGGSGGGSDDSAVLALGADTGSVYMYWFPSLRLAKLLSGVVERLVARLGGSDFGAAGVGGTDSGRF
jgi:hypothetical protein